MVLLWTLVFGLADAAALKNGASFVAQTPPPSSMKPGQTFRVELRMKNSGTSTWTAAAGYKLGAQESTDNTNWRRGRLSVPASTPPGKEAVFSFEVKAPAAPGEYHFKWRMVREKVEWFGHASADVVVKVAEPEPELGPNPSPGVWNGTVPNLRSVVEGVASQNPELLARSCQDQGGTWEFMDKVVKELRARDRRFGFNCKRGNCGDASKDGVAYYAGYGDPADGKGPIVWVDTIEAHCGNAKPSWQVFPFENNGAWISRH
ncbi:MAG: hypothetical protein HY925_07545 [Elusimicrobia bacterium]|nr:hypothetical protein [Elusimicrobiota bacterium]